MMYNPYESDYSSPAVCIGLFIGLVITVIIIYYLYTKAEEYGQSGCLWAFFGLLFPVPVLIIFLLVNMNAESRLRGRRGEQYITQPGIYGGQQPAMPPKAAGRSQPPDPDFRDDHLDSLIEDGRLSEARKYLREMIDMARSMHDETGLRNYAQYEPRINKAAMDGTRRRRDIQ